MGRKTYVNAITERLLDTKNFVSVNKYAQQRYIAAQKNKIRPSMKDESFTEYLLTSHQQSMVTKFRKLYNFAKDKSRYVYGLPTSNITTEAGNDIEIAYENYLNKIENGGVTLLKDRLSPKNLHFYAWVELYNKYQYSGIDNSIGFFTVKEGTTCYLESAILLVSEATASLNEIDNNNDEGGLAFNYGQTFDRVRDLQREQEQQPVLTTSNDALVINYVFKKDGVVHHKSRTIDLSHIHPTIKAGDEPDELEYMQLVYLKDDVVKIFTYGYNSGKIPELDDAVFTKVDIGQYYPRIYLRENADNIRGRADNDIKKIHTKAILRRLDLDLDDFTKMIMDAIGEVNNDYKTVFMHLTVSVNKDMEDNTTAKYLYNYMDRLYGLSKPTKVTNVRGSMLQDVSDISYTQTIGYSKIEKKIVTGKLKTKKGRELEIGEYVTAFDVNIVGKSLSKRKITSIHNFCCQLSDTQYLVLSVSDLYMKHHITGKTITENGDSEQLTLPLDKALLDKLNFVEKDELFNRALQITILTSKTVKKKWYETGVFKVVMAVVSIAMNIIVPGSGFTMMALLEAVAVTVIVGLAIDVAIKVLIELAINLGINSELLAVLTGIAMIAAASYGGGRIDFSKAFNAKEMLKALNKTFEAYQKGIANDISEIQKAMQEFSVTSKDKYEKLEEAQAMLNTGVIPVNLDLLKSEVVDNNYLYLGETVEEFYTRTIATDVTEMTTNLVENFYDVTTSLPKPGTVTVPEREDVADILLIK